MKFILIGVAVVIVAFLVALAAYVAAKVRTNKRNMLRVPRPRCVHCLGSGWTNREPERTFTFVGDGFEDVHTPAVMCVSCGGSGQVERGLDRR